jgi:CheY-like chemotaxis protein
VPDRIVTDPTRLRQILVNLVGNAIKFTEHGAVRIVVRYQPAHEGADSSNGAGEHTRKSVLIVDVVDTGIGMTAEQQLSLFEPFAQADVSTTRRYGGSGLGLSISRRLARMMDGDLRISSEMNRGSTFHLSLPIRAAESSGMHAPGDVPQVLAASRPAFEPLRHVGGRVLLAEDGPDMREIISLHLRRAGCEVTVAEDGRIARDKARAAVAEGRPYDIILMDMQMPVMDGYTATSRLRAEGYRGAIIALTANAMKEDRNRCLRAGCDEYAAKPLDVPGLLRLMESLGAGVASTVKDTLVADPLLRELTQRFCEGTRAIIDTMRARLKAGEISALAAAAHQLAGAGGSYGFHDITREARTLERQAKDGAEAGMLGTQIDRVAEVCAGARHWMATTQPTVSGSVSEVLPPAGV